MKRTPQLIGGEEGMAAADGGYGISISEVAALVVFKAGTFVKSV